MEILKNSGKPISPKIEFWIGLLNITAPCTVHFPNSKKTNFEININRVFSFLHRVPTRVSSSFRTKSTFFLLVLQERKALLFLPASGKRGGWVSAINFESPLPPSSLSATGKLGEGEEEEDVA